MFFTCFGCGETLKKSAVDRHSQTCKSCWEIVCVDCNTRFEGAEYAKHTTCISEAEKYEKSVFKGTKGGKRDPQAEWCETIGRAAAAGGAHAALLGTLTGYGNCPRKIRPFVAFCKNSLKVHNEKLLGELFAQIQAHLPPRKPAKGAAGEDKEGGSEGEGEGEAAEPAPAAAAAAAADEAPAAGQKRAKKTKRQEEAAPEEGEGAADPAAAVAAAEEEAPDAGGSEAEAKAAKKAAKRARKAAEAAAEAEAATSAAPAAAAAAPAEAAAAAAAAPSKKELREAKQAARAAAAAASGVVFDAKGFVYESLGKAKNNCLKPKKLAQGASKHKGGSSAAVLAKIEALVAKGKLVRCDFRGSEAASGKKANKGKYVRKPKVRAVKGGGAAAAGAEAAAAAPAAAGEGGAAEEEEEEAGGAAAAEEEEEEEEE